MQGLRARIQPDNSYVTEGAINEMQRDVMNMVKIQKDYYEQVVTELRDIYEYGSPGVTKEDAEKGMAFGRRYVHLYGKDKFTEYYDFDGASFTNNSLYNIGEQAGLNYVKAIYMSGGDGPRNIAWMNWQSYREGEGFEYQIAEGLSSSVKQFLRDKEGTLITEKEFGGTQGDRDMTWEVEDIVEYTDLGEKLVDFMEDIRSQYEKLDELTDDDWHPYEVVELQETGIKKEEIRQQIISEWTHQDMEDRMSMPERSDVKFGYSDDEQTPQEGTSEEK